VVVVVEGGNVAGVAMPCEPFPAAVTLSHTAPLLPHTHAGHGPCWALLSHGYGGKTQGHAVCLTPCPSEVMLAVYTCHCPLAAKDHSSPASVEYCAAPVTRTKC
jgi:hypothetical protein